MANLSNSKGIGQIQATESYSKLTAKWNLLKQDISLPAACLNKKIVDNNINWMNEFISNYPGMKLAPHGKTTMCPKLFQLQLSANTTWGITLATASQVQVAYNFGIKNILLANQLIGKRNIEIIQNIMKFDSKFQFICIVDSIENIQQLGLTFKANNNQKLQVLIEIGHLNGGRTGVRNDIELIALLYELLKWKDTIQLVGLEFFEGTLTSAEEVRLFIKSRIPSALNLILTRKDSLLDGIEEIILTGAGSAYFDIVAEELVNIKNLYKSKHKLSLILRAGCYITQDVGIYQEAYKRMKLSSTIISEMNSSLKPALQIWAYVQSKPEQDLIVIGFGRRDVSFDAGLPKPALYFQPSSSSSSLTLLNSVKDIRTKDWIVTKLMDQHAFLKVDKASFEEIKIGDMISFDILHPCTTFDKWRNLLLIDDEFNVLEVLETYF